MRWIAGLRAATIVLQVINLCLPQQSTILLNAALFFLWVSVGITGAKDTK